MRHDTIKYSDLYFEIGIQMINHEALISDFTRPFLHLRFAREIEGHRSHLPRNQRQDY